MNPITRRPGPGRGRPRKQPPVSADAVSASESVAAPADQQAQQEPPAPEPVADGASAPPPPPLEAMPLDASVGDLEEPDAKRPRLDENTDPALDDEAVLSALAAHSNATAAEQYDQE